MSERFPSERFLMTVPKPIHDWLSKEADKLGVTVQDRIRVMLEEQQKRKSEHVTMHGELPKKKQWGKEELEEKCYSIGKAVYDTIATERNRLQIIELSDDGSALYLGDMVIPVISKNFYPLDPSNELLELNICDAVRKVAELENKLLSICGDGEPAYQAMPLRCSIWYKNGVWEGAFRLCINTDRTPTLTDVSRAVS